MKLPKFTLRGSRRPADAVIDSLGKLERETMEYVWQQKEVSVRDVLSALQGCLAYTTVMTTLDRLYKKGVLDRRREGRAFLYSPRYTHEELERGVAEDVIGSLFEGTTGRIEPVLACIVDAMCERDTELLDELDRLVQEKRREIGIAK
jgi:predicted transcriptional regulator